MSSNIFSKDPDGIRAISNLESSTSNDWRTFKEAIARRINELSITSCLVENDTRSKWHQGRVQELCDLLNSFASAKDTRTALGNRMNISTGGGI